MVVQDIQAVIQKMLRGKLYKIPISAILKSMDFKGRTLGIVISSFLLANTAFFGLTRFYYGRALTAIEKEDALAAYNRVLQIVADDLEQLEVITIDWSVWDDTYEYVEDRNKEYEDSNLTPVTVQSIQLSHLAIYDTEGQLIISRRADETHPQENQDSMAILGHDSDLFAKAYEKGQASVVFAMDDRIELVCAGAILHSDGSGEPVGVLVMSRPIDEARIGRWSHLTGTVVSIAVTPKSTLKERQPSIKFTKNGEIKASGMLPSDTKATNIAIVSVTPSRRPEGFSPNLLFMYFISLIVVSVVIGAITLLMMEGFVVSRLRALGEELKRIAESGAPSLRVTVKGKDELARLGEILNKTLDALEQSFTENERQRHLLAESLAERDAMFQEIQHRVKNNLQIVASLLSLQETHAREGSTQAALHDGRRRVLAMAFVHEELYTSELLNQVSLLEYLKRLSISVRHGFDLESRVKFSSDLDSIVTDIEQAVPFGLIASEVLSNAYAHAFPEDRCAGGTVTMKLKRIEGKEARFDVIDDGIGLPQEMRSGETLGITLIKTLVGQLGATMEYAPVEGGGTHFSMIFNVPTIEQKVDAAS